MNDNLEKLNENKAISIDCGLDRLLIGKIEIFLKNNGNSSIWGSQNLDSFLEGALNNYEKKLFN